MSNFIKLNNPDYVQGDEQVVTGTDAEEILGGGTGNDTVLGQDGNDLIFGDTLTSNSNVPFEYSYFRG